MIRGALFQVASNLRKPCGIPCPVTDVVPEPQIPIEFMLDTSLNPVRFIFILIQKLIDYETFLELRNLKFREECSSEKVKCNSK